LGKEAGACSGFFIFDYQGFNIFIDELHVFFFFQKAKYFLKTFVISHNTSILVLP
tara:strand:- start:271929 stop:272093 length:165 start_codon:yes stop_codon:yes gene_type:complete